MRLINDKRGFIDDLNWGAFVLLTAIGYGAYMIQLMILRGMEFVIPVWVKLIVFAGIPVAAFVFTKIQFD